MICHTCKYGFSLSGWFFSFQMTDNSDNIKNLKVVNFKNKFKIKKHTNEFINHSFICHSSIH